MAVTPATYAPYAVAEMGEDVCAPAVCGAGVSYTHLDVYKRQACCRSIEGRCECYTAYRKRLQIVIGIASFIEAHC